MKTKKNKKSVKSKMIRVLRDEVNLAVAVEDRRRRRKMLLLLLSVRDERGKSNRRRFWRRAVKLLLFNLQMQMSLSSSSLHFMLPSNSTTSDRVSEWLGWPNYGLIITSLKNRIKFDRIFSISYLLTKLDQI